jgi:hypothetical protein
MNVQVGESTSPPFSARGRGIQGWWVSDLLDAALLAYLRPAGPGLALVLLVALLATAVALLAFIAYTIWRRRR